MNSEIGRFFEGHFFETQKLMKAIYDLAMGEGQGAVHAHIEGRELVFATEEGGRPGFLRMLPNPTSVTLAFPSGGQILDPAKRMKGPTGARTRLTLNNTLDLDPYVRRLIDQAYTLAAG